MVGPLELATIGAFAAGLDAERMMRPAHVALGRRGLSFGNRHGETLLRQCKIDPSSRKVQDGWREKQGAELNRTDEAMQERFRQEKASGFTPLAPVLRADWA
jgi:hypothetical protein